jgi:hypothetical protein
MDDLDLATRLREASRRVSPVLDLDAVERARDTAQRRRQRRDASAAIFLSVAVIGGLFAGLRLQTHSGTGLRTGDDGTSGVTQPPLLPDQFLYINRTIVSDGGRIVTETWWGADGSGRVAFHCTIPDCGQVYGPPPTGSFGPGTFPTDDDVTGLSSDPTVLQGQMEERTAPGGRSPEPEFSPGPEITAGVTAGSLWDAASNILDDPTGGPDLRAALFEVASGIPGVDPHQAVTDPAGRPAVALELASIGEGGGTSWLYFDPSTQQLMASAATCSSGYTLYDEGIVTSTDASPSGDQWLFPPAGN